MAGRPVCRSRWGRLKETENRAAQAADDFIYGNQIAALTLHGFTFPQNPDNPKRSRNEFDGHLGS